MATYSGWRQAVLRNRSSQVVTLTRSNTPRRIAMRSERQAVRFGAGPGVVGITRGVRRGSVGRFDAELRHLAVDGDVRDGHGFAADGTILDIGLFLDRQIEG